MAGNLAIGCVVAYSSVDDALGVHSDVWTSESKAVFVTRACSAKTSIMHRHIMHRHITKWIGSLLTVAAVFCGTSAHAAGVQVNMKRLSNHAGVVQAPYDQGTAELTLDPNLQADVQKLLKQSRAPEAAAVVIDVRTGNVLAWASVDSKGRDLVAEPYAPPASLFKVVTAASLVEDAGVPNQAQVCYVGGKRSVRLDNLRKSGTGGATCSTLGSAVGYSQNMVMAGLAVRHLKSNQLQTMAKNLGFNGRVPIDIAVSSGTSSVPNTKEGLAKAAAGFGPGTLTPLEAAYMMTVVARNGERPAIRVVQHLQNKNGKRQATAAPAIGAKRAVSERTAKRLQNLLQVTTSEGTAAKSFRDSQGNRYLGSHAGGGKTGTLTRGNPTRLFTWYAGYAPSKNPQIAVAIMVANEEKWWRKGPEVARDVLRSYFARASTAGITHPIRNATANKSK